jgi:glycosyltransferase involved in cell wall biosynthesis
MDNRKQISVIIPVHNGEQYLAQCIENLLKQTYKPLEIIVVDDGSTDQSLAIARRYPVTLLSLQHHGVSHARNAGIEAAQGDFLHFMDVDDEINRRFYEKSAEALLQTDADIACAGVINELKPHRTIVYFEQQTYTSSNDKFRITNAGKWGYVWRYLFRTDFLKNNRLRFEETLTTAEDLVFTIQAIHLSRTLVVVPEAIYRYIRRENSTMTRTDRSHIRNRHRDLLYAKTFRHKDARRHGLTLPGISTNPFAFFYIKWLT